MKKDNCKHNRYRWSVSLNEGICIDCMARLLERPEPAPPSSPTATAEEFLDNQGYVKDMFVGKERVEPQFQRITVIRLMTEYASLKEQEAHNRAVQECIESMSALISKRFGLTVNNQLYYLESEEVLKELEKLK